MADLERTVEIIFKSIDQTGQGLSSVSGKLKEFESSVSKVTDPIANLTKKVLKTEAAVLSLAAAYGGYAVTQAAKYQTATNDLQKVLDDGQSVGAYEDEIRNLSETYGVAASDVVRGAAEFKQAGFDVEASFKLQRDALDLVIAGDLSAADAAETLKSILKGLNAEYAEAPRVIEAMNNVSDKFGTNLPKLAEGMRDLSPILEQMGFSFEQGVGAITPIIERFGSGSEAARALKTGLVTLISSTGNVKKALSDLGVSQLDSNDQFKSSREIFEEVSKALQGMETKQKAVTLAQLFGKEQVGRLSAVFSDFSQVTKITNTALEETGSVSKEVEIRLKSAEAQVDKFKVTFQNLAIAVGNELLSNFTGIAGAATEINKSFAQVVRDGGLEPLFTALKPLLEEFEETLRTVAKNLPEAFAGVNFNGLIQSFRNLGGEIGGIFDNLDLSTPEGLQQVLQKLVDFVSLLTNASAGVVGGFSPFVSLIEDLIDAAGDGGGDLIKFTSNIAGIASAINASLPALRFLADSLGALSQALTIVVGARGLVAFAPAVGSAASSLLLFNPAAAAFAGAMGAIAFAISENVEAFNNWKDRVNGVNKEAEASAKVIKRLPESFEELSKKAGTSIQSMDDFKKAVEDGLLVADEAEGGWRSAGEGVRDFDAEVEAALGNSIELRQETEKNTKATKDGANAVIVLTQQEKEAIKVTGEWVKIVKDGQVTYERRETVLKSTSKTVAQVKTEVAKLAEQEILAIKHANDMEKTLVEIASNEKIKSLEFAAKIEVANIEADAKRVVAAYEAISEGISSTNDLIGSLNESFNNASGFDKLAIDDQIDAANDRADRLLDQQELLNNANVKHLNARTRQIEEGGGEITLIADNLAPELQAVLESLINNIRLKAVAEGVTFITG